MLTIILLVALLLGFYSGYRRGLALQLIRLVGYIITFMLATRYYQPLSEIVEMLIPFPSVQPDTSLVFYDEATSFFLDDAFYYAITFILIGVIGWLVTNFLSILFNRIMYYDFMNHINAIGGGVVNLFITYVIIFFLFFVLSLIPVEFIQQQFVDNPIAYNVVANTPFFSDFAAETWLNVNPFN